MIKIFDLEVKELEFNDLYEFLKIIEDVKVEIPKNIDTEKSEDRATLLFRA